MTKILIDEAVVRQALEYLNLQKMYGPAMGFGNTTVDDPITALNQALADAALDQMAENAKELGLSYDAPVAQIDTSPERVEKEAGNKDVRPPNCGTGYCSCVECLFEKSGIGITKGGAA